MIKDAQKKYKREGFYDLYKVSLDKMGNIGTIKEVMEDIDTKYHEGPVAYCENTGELFISLSNFDNSQISFRPFQTRKVNLKIVTAKKQNGSWVIVYEFPYNNPKYSVGHPAISSKGDTLIFVSDIARWNRRN